MRNNYDLQMQAAARSFLTYDAREIAQRFALPTAFHMFFEEMK